jgi:hypothetical protein
MRLVLIEWLDSHRNPNSWASLDEFPDPQPLICRSVGWLLHDTPECKVVVPHFAGEQGAAPEQGCGDMTIPTRAVLRVVDLQAPAQDPPAPPPEEKP